MSANAALVRAVPNRRALAAAWFEPLTQDEWLLPALPTAISTGDPLPNDDFNRQISNLPFKLKRQLATAIAQQADRLASAAKTTIYVHTFLAGSTAGAATPDQIGSVPVNSSAT